MKELNDYLKYLKKTYPLDKIKVKTRYFAEEYIPHEVYNYNGKQFAGIARRTTDNTVIIHVATNRSVYSALVLLAHEYRHAWQHDKDRRDRKEIDAYLFSLPVTKKYCIEKGIPIV